MSAKADSTHAKKTRTAKTNSAHAKKAHANKPNTDQANKGQVPNTDQISIDNAISRFLVEHRDETYQAFQAKLIPSIDSATIIGVRTPALRSFAKTLANDPAIDMFLATLPHATFEENQLHAFIVSNIKDYDAYVAALEHFLPFLDNWATCDQMSPRKLAEQPKRALTLVRQWLADDRPYIVRYGIGVLLQLFLDDLFEPEQMQWVADVDSEEYYVNMMRAWYLAEAMAKQPKSALNLIEAQELDIWTHNKAIQKARESRRISDEMKKYLNTLKRR